MKITFDPNKSLKNTRERNLPFDHAAELDWETAHIEADFRKPYPEHRLVAYAYLFGRLHVCCFALLMEDVRIISLRRANKKEEKKYEKEIAHRQAW